MKKQEQDGVVTNLTVVRYHLSTIRFLISQLISNTTCFSSYGPKPPKRYSYIFSYFSALRIDASCHLKQSTVYSTTVFIPKSYSGQNLFIMIRLV